MPERRDTKASVIPSARYSCPGSPDKFFKGSTASDLIVGWIELRVLRTRIASQPDARIASNTAVAASGMKLAGRRRLCRAVVAAIVPLWPAWEGWGVAGNPAV